MSDDNKEKDKKAGDPQVNMKDYQETKAKLEKLEKIFDERQTKALKKEDVLKKDELLKALGIEKDPGKDPMDLINDKLTSTNQALKDLQDELAKERDAKTKLEKKTQVKDLAERAGLNKDLTIKLIDDFNGDLEAQVNAIAEKYPELKIKKSVGAGSNPASVNVPKDIDTQIAEALKNGDVMKSIQLKQLKAKG